MKIKRILLAGFIAFFASVKAHASESNVNLGEILPLWSVIPFAGMLLSIALFPLLAPKIWKNHYAKISGFWALCMAVPFVFAFGKSALYEIAHILIIDYIPFVILLWSLYTVSGGIQIEGSHKGKPTSNLMMLIFGTVIASWIGTTGASMLLIKPVIHGNMQRKNKAHVIVFFIFLVSNIGGSLTPLGDPPLFLGFLHGVPFFWTFNVFTETAFVSAILLAVFFFFDSFYYKREIQAGTLKVNTIKNEPTVVRGLHNLLFLTGIVLGILLSGVLKLGQIDVLGVNVDVQSLLRDAILILMGYLSLKTTKKTIRKANEFTWHPIVEVAILFAGIFITIIPMIDILRAGSNGHLAFVINSVNKPWHYFWITGVLSSFLDNAPTYLTFLNTALGNFYAGLPESEAVARLIAENGIYLKAISTGAVFMGANTYIGNAPNFMVLTIAEDSGIKMPSFFGYMAYSIGILVPVFILTTFVFF